ncbi:cbb3-type cytochrome oxidase assembly protein CcoS [Massilia oculi]|uniref:Cbb3-type cytochrome oxidase assembly protein CcoS n=1 Tax=Massilia hydrophila TaxID=3044279 RepID=A0ABS7Y6E4_9BURK|nr:cbb3-type cytochrome oxidase assembly protein CcoS [Massilia oculi]MCA1855258.1 cbb3-type cytochrome oxidase assembly protein CcoS [Massilia oculi]
MEALYLLVPLSVMLVALAVWIFFGAAESGQFDDLEGPGMRILVDDDRADVAGASVQGRAGRVGGSEKAG